VALARDSAITIEALGSMRGTQTARLAFDRAHLGRLRLWFNGALVKPTVYIVKTKPYG
jgi:hypothetical protein